MHRTGTDESYHVNIVADIILILHIVIVLWVVSVPFLKVSGLHRITHAIALLSIMLHWLINDDTCVLTLIECKLRGISSRNQSLVHRVIAPVYNAADSDDNNVSNKLAWALAIILFLYNGSAVMRGIRGQGFAQYISFKRND